MKWNNFLYSLPAQGHEILIWNQLVDEDRKKINKFYYCQSHEYLKVIGENNMNFSCTFWTLFPSQEIINHVFKELNIFRS